MLRTRVGYTGGAKLNPTYHSLGDHSEAVEIDFDPAVVSYEDLLRVFWKSHDPASRSWSRQYRAAIFYHNGKQKQLALASRDQQVLYARGRIQTEIVPATRFYRAEDYHQKYYLRMKPRLLHALTEIYRGETELVDATLTARLNGYLAGHVPAAELEAELTSLGLSAEQGRIIMDSLPR